MKTQSLNTFTPNATFDHKRNLSNIKNLSGLVYLDIDGCTEINYNNPYIFATWLSLSAKGRGVLVKAQNLNEDNFSFVYESIAQDLELNVDPQTKDLSRQVVISYDPDIYINYNSQIYYYSGITPKNNFNIPLTVPKKKEGKVCDLKGDSFLKDLKWDNVGDYDLQGMDYVVFDEPQYFAKAYIPETIPEGKRHQTISSVAHQIKALNPHLKEEELYYLIHMLNSRCEDPLPSAEIEGIKRKLQEKLKDGDLTPLPNYPRHIIFSDKIDKKDRQRLGAQMSGRIKVRKTKKKIQECLDDWNLNLGKTTNEKIAEITGLSKKTVDKYSREFRVQKKMINKNCTT